MMKYALLITSMLIASPVWACERIEGLYQSVSETHWNFALEVSAGKAKLTYTNYSSGAGDTRTDYETISQGYCAKIKRGYLLTFSERTIAIEHHAELSHSIYGAEGGSPGITGEFIENQKVHLWLSQ
jgi:hypothetical protein